MPRRRLGRVDVRRVRASTSAGLSRPGWRCRRSAWPTESWIASGAASTSVSIAFAISSIPVSIAGSPGMPWSTATSKQRPDHGMEESVEAVLLRRDRDTTSRDARRLPDLTIDRTLAHRRARPGRGAALRPRRRDARRQGAERRPRGARARASRPARLADTRPHGPRRRRADRRGGHRASGGPPAASCARRRSCRSAAAARRCSTSRGRWSTSAAGRDYENARPRHAERSCARAASRRRPADADGA